MKEVIAYKCEFCPNRRPFATKGSAKRHEKMCYHNPATRSCATCKHLESETVQNEYQDGSLARPYVARECEFNLLGNGIEEPEGQLRTQCKSWEGKGDAQ